MNKAELSSALFDEGLALKRQGNYYGALAKYKDSIEMYPDDPELAATVSAMGKVFYLTSQYSKAVLAYETSFLMTIEPAMLQDYADLINDEIDDRRRSRFLGFLSNPARHIGHALRDADNSANQQDINFYLTGLKGKPQAAYDDTIYDNSCTDFGFRKLEEMMKLYYRLRGDVSGEIHNRMIQIL